MIYLTKMTNFRAKLKGVGVSLLFLIVLGVIGLFILLLPAIIGIGSIILTAIVAGWLTVIFTKSNKEEKGNS